MLDIEIPVGTLSEAEEKPSKTYRLDLDSGRIVGTADNTEAVKQAIDKALRTARYNNLIYDSEYGSELQQLLYDKDTTKELIQTAFPQLIKEALAEDTRILDVDNFSFSFEGDGVHISFTAHTIFGKTDIREVI